MPVEYAVTGGGRISASQPDQPGTAIWMYNLCTTQTKAGSNTRPLVKKERFKMPGKYSSSIGEVSLEEGGVIPVTKATANLAEIMKNSDNRPIIVTQNGVPIGAVLGLELFAELRELARRQARQISEPEDNQHELHANTVNGL